MQETQAQFLGHDDPLEKEMATHSSILAWEILEREKPGGLQFIRLQRVGHDVATEQPLTSFWVFFFFLFSLTSFKEESGMI